MGKFKNISFKKIEKLLKIYGWYKRRQNGSHISYVKEGSNRPIVIPFHEKEVDSYIVVQIIKALDITEEEFLSKIRKV
jgi:predicted RNA binding protein YcfA (HicA-like mRNA interferase family)